MVPAAVIPEVVQVATLRQVKVWQRHTIANNSASSLPHTAGKWARALVNGPLRPLRLDEHVKTDFAEQLVQRLHCAGAPVCSGALEPAPMATPIQSRCSGGGGGAPQHPKQSRGHPQRRLHAAPPHRIATLAEPAPAPTGPTATDRTSEPAEQITARPDPEEQPQAPPRSAPAQSRPAAPVPDVPATLMSRTIRLQPAPVSAERTRLVLSQLYGTVVAVIVHPQYAQVTFASARSAGMALEARHTCIDGTRCTILPGLFLPTQISIPTNVLAGKGKGKGAWQVERSLGDWQFRRERMDAEGRGRHRASECTEYSRWAGRRGRKGKKGRKGRKPQRANLGRTEQGSHYSVHHQESQSLNSVAPETPARSPRVEQGSYYSVHHQESQSFNSVAPETAARSPRVESELVHGTRCPHLYQFDKVLTLVRPAEVKVYCPLCRGS